MKRIVMTGVLAALLGVAGAAQAEPGGDRPDGRPEQREGKRMMGGPGQQDGAAKHMLMRMLDNPDKAREFGISPEQAKALKASFHEMEKKMVSLRADVETAELDVRELMEQDDPDEAALMAAIEKVGQARTAVQKTLAQQRLAVGKIVSPETMKKVRERVQERMRQSKGAEDRGPRGKDDAPWKNGPMMGPKDGPDGE